MREQHCARTKQLGRVDLGALAGVKFDPAQVRVTDDGIDVRVRAE